jgi:hypothetical protein
LYENNLDIPLIDLDFLSNISSVLTKKGKGNTKKGDNLKVCIKLEKFFEEHYSCLMYNSTDSNIEELKLDANYLSQILRYNFVQIVTSIENNIVLHFNEHLKKFIKISLNMFHSKLLNDSINKTIKRKEINKQLILIFTDLNEGTKKCNECYHIWMDKIKSFVLPIISETTSHILNINKNPQLYLKNMIYMNLEVRKSNVEDVKLYFIDYVKKYINISVKRLSTETLKKYIKGVSFTYKNKKMNKKEKQKQKLKQRKEIKKQKIKKVKIIKEIDKQIPIITEDILNKTLNSNKKYHTFIDEQKKIIFPENVNKLNFKHLNKNPEMYIKNVDEIKKAFNYGNLQVFPLRKSNVLKHIPIDTVTLVDILIHEDVNSYRKNITTREHEIWSKFFDLTNEVFNRKGYTFKYRIVTDLMSASIDIIKTEYAEKRNIKLKNKTKGRKEHQNNKKILEKLKDSVNIVEKKKTKKKREIEAELKENYKKLSKEEQKNIKKKISKKKEIEYPYFDELTEDQERMLTNKKINKVYCDPGKNNLLYMMDEKENTLKYTNKERMLETKRIEKQEKIEKYKRRTGIEELESKLTEYKSKSCNVKEFKEYVKIKNEINEKVKEEYGNLKINKLNWYTYVNTLKSESKMINKIKNKFGKDIIIIIGDWSVGKQMRNFISTPNIGIKRKLNKNFRVFSIDEYGTSKYSCKSGKENENLIVTDKKGVKRSLHPVLTYKMKNGQEGCINRDKNSVKNMKLITEMWIKNKKRPQSLCRQTKEEKEVNKKTLIKRKQKKFTT